MTTHVEQIAAQIRLLNPGERQRLLTLIPDFGRMNTAPLNAAALQFNGQNISVAAYEALAEDEKFKFLDKAENENTEWLREKFWALRAAWMMVVDGNIAAFGEAMDTYPNDGEFLKLCQKFGKYPFVFFNPLVLNMDEFNFDSRDKSSVTSIQECHSASLPWRPPRHAVPQARESFWNL